MSRQWFRSAIRPHFLAIVVLSLMLGGHGGLTVARAANPACVELTPSGDPGRDRIGENGDLAGGGSGGTGKMPGGSGGTGIVGTITAFGSVCINGLEIDYGAGTPISRNETGVRSSDLAVGQVVAIIAGGDQPQLAARRILILDALQGPVTGLVPHQRILYVMGQPVIVSDATRPDGRATLERLKPGSLARVSGFRDATGAIHATRVEIAPRLDQHSAVGTLNRSASGALNLSGLPLRTTARHPPDGAGENALVRGRWNGRQLVVRQIVIDPLRPLLEDTARVIAEGLVLEHRDSRTLRMTNFDVELTPRTRLVDSGDDRLLAEGQRVLVSGHFAGNNRIVAEAIKASASSGSHGAHPPNRRFSPAVARPANRDIGQRPASDDAPAPGDRDRSAAPGDNANEGRITAPHQSEPTQQGEPAANRSESAHGEPNSPAAGHARGDRGGGHQGSASRSGGASRGR